MLTRATNVQNEINCVTNIFLTLIATLQSVTGENEENNESILNGLHSPIVRSVDDEGGFFE